MADGQKRIALDLGDAGVAAAPVCGHPVLSISHPKFAGPGGKARCYAEASDRIAAFLAKYDGMDTPAVMATISSVLRMAFPDFVFCGFYVRDPKRPDTLIIGPYQGAVLACGRIAWGKGVCGAAASAAETQIVADVLAIENYIACDDETRSEIVVPVLGKWPAGDNQGAEGGAEEKERQVVAVLDIDHGAPGAFDSVDQAGLEAIVARFL